jgi:hypothetical protein
MIRCRFFAGFGWEYGILQEWVPHHDALMTLVRLHNNFATIASATPQFSLQTCNDVFMLMHDIHIRSQDYLNFDGRSGGFWQILCNRWTSVNS